MKITLEMLLEKNACSEGMEWVTKNIPTLSEGGCEYREFIEKLESSKKREWADHVGPCLTCLEGIRPSAAERRVVDAAVAWHENVEWNDPKCLDLLVDLKQAVAALLEERKEEQRCTHQFCSER